jgi:hypothetical protein
MIQLTKSSLDFTSKAERRLESLFYFGTNRPNSIAAPKSQLGVRGRDGHAPIFGSSLARKMKAKG